MGTATENFNELCEQSARLFENALKAGVAIQQESSKWFTDALRGVGAVRWEADGQAAMEQAMTNVQKQIEQTVQVMSDNAKTSLDLLEKAFQIRQSESATEGEACTREMWQTALGALRKNTEATVSANARLMESWGNVARALCGGAAGGSQSK